METFIAINNVTIIFLGKLYHILKTTITDAIIVKIDDVRRLPELPFGGRVGFFSEINI